MLVLLAVAGAVVALLVTAGLSGTLVYYKTPTEVAQSTANTGHAVRLGGRVVPGTLHESAGEARFRIADGHGDVPVVVHTALPDTFREGQDAVVDGILGQDGVLRADTVAVKHSNEYRAPTSGVPSEPQT